MLLSELVNIVTKKLTMKLKREMLNEHAATRLNLVGGKEKNSSATPMGEKKVIVDKQWK